MQSAFRPFRLYVIIVSALFAIAPIQALSQDASSCGYPDWFAVQHAQVEGRHLSPLCKGELDASEDHRSLAERELNAVIAAAPQSAAAYKAHAALSHYYLRIGRFHDSEMQIEAMLADKPNASDLVNMHSLIKILANHPDMTISNADATASVNTHVMYGNVFAPVTVNGTPASYMLDTGAGFSLMSEAEAAHLRLRPESSTATMNDISGRPGPELKMVVVDDLILGATHLHHVPFMVVADTMGAFSGIPPDQHGILGIPPLVALGKFTFLADGKLVIAGKAEPAISKIPILFEGTAPLTQIRYRDRALTVTLDTGADQTVLYPRFGLLFPDVVQSGKKHSHDLTGISGTTQQQSVSVPRLTLQFGRNVDLTDATILLDKSFGESTGAAANLGFDLMRQAEPFTIDFRTMNIEFSTSGAK